MLNGRTALVTGSTDGLGLAIAEGLAASGADVALHGLEPASVGNSEAHRLSKTYGVRTCYEQADLSDPEATQQLVERTAKALSRPLVLINNAVTRHFHPIEEMPDEAWERSLAVNVSAPFYLVREILPAMKEAGWGRISNLSSIYSQRGAFGRIDYVTAKTALLGMTRAIAIETAGTGVTCNAVCPGTASSPAILLRIKEQAEAECISEEEARQNYIKSRHPTGDFVSLDAVAAIVVYLCGYHSGNITGAAFPIDGGWQAA